MPIRSINIPEELDQKIEKRVKTEFSNNRSKAYTVLLSKALEPEQKPLSLDKPTRTEIERLIESKLSKNQLSSSEEFPVYQRPE